MSEKIVSRKFSQKSQKNKIIKAKLKEMVTPVVDFHSSTTYLQSQKFLALVTTSKYFFQSVRKILSSPCRIKRFRFQYYKETEEMICDLVYQTIKLCIEFIPHRVSYTCGFKSD